MGSRPAHSELSFKVKHLMISNLRGEFRKFNAVIEGEDFSIGLFMFRSMCLQSTPMTMHGTACMGSPVSLMPDNHSTIAFLQPHSINWKETTTNSTANSQSKALQILYPCMLNLVARADPWGNESRLYHLRNNPSRRLGTQLECSAGDWRHAGEWWSSHSGWCARVKKQPSHWMTVHLVMVERNF